MTQRTTKQNKSLHLWCKQIAKDLDDGGFTQRVILDLIGEEVGLQPDEHWIKSMFRNIATAKYGRGSTAELETDEIQSVYLELDKIIGEATGVTRPWPSLETLEYEQRGFIR